MKLICELLLFRPSTSMFWTLPSGLGDRWRRRARMTRKIIAAMAAQPPTEPTTTPAMAPPLKLELSSLLDDPVDDDVG